MMLCPQCGKQMPPGAEECPYCGYEINVENLVRQSFPEGEDDDNSGISAHMAGIIIVIIIIAAAIAGYWAMH